jgi:hypothetical protein
MGNRKTSGLTKRGRIWHLNKQFRGVRIRESAATSILTEAVELLASRIEGVRQSQLYGVRPLWTFREAAQKYLKENQHKRSVSDDERHLAMLDPFIGDLLLSRVYMETLRPFIEKRSKDGVKTKTINLSLETVRRILRLAADEWRDKQGATWLEMAPKINLFRITDARKPHSLSVEEEQFLFGTVAPEGFRRVRVHDLKHTFGRRLRAAGVSFEDRQDLLGHKSQRITTHYSQPELSNLIAAAEKACG